ncbi:flagellar protein FlhE [Kineobactrum salinum]|uniref:Flagellar protein FlhE n=1 Tax=Kineobactrum salinum TaxID=2708301 RepID=A0A6C0U007_9GAMM|nr:flagellar protein FlhE [Kineobactrum salinum]QIB64297.1 flagellar protein FlhE [Kineobactrum salinum]
MTAGAGCARSAGLILAGVVWSGILLQAGASSAAPGSWAASAAPVTVAMAGRTYHSRALPPPRPELVAESVIGRVSWRFRVPAGRAVNVWLCSGEHCEAISGQRGSSEALAGHAAARPLQFRFALRPGEQRAVTVRELQLLVDYH